jgi:uncharacterized protein YecE (DUF72 family)
MIHVGTSGYNYPEWKGRFYPADLSASRMLSYYATQLTTVEINYTFYRLPTAKVVAGWAVQVPGGFRFALKTPRRITHERRMKDCTDAVQAFCQAAGALGTRLGPILIQLPPNLRFDPATFDRFLDTWPPLVRAAFEFRHPSWLDEAVFDRLRARNLALCIADSEGQHTPVVATADFGYARLRDEGYGEEDLGRWAALLAAQTSWREAFVYFKHEDQGRGPEFARAFLEHLRPAGAAPGPPPGADASAGGA